MPSPHSNAPKHVFAIALLLAVASSGSATPTDPFLALRNATVLPSSSPLLRVEGSFHADDLAQVPFPLQILVRSLASGTTYLRVDPFGTAFQGDDGALGDGLQLADVAPLLDAGTAHPPVSIIELSQDRIDLVLPDWFPSGAAEVQLFVWNEGDPVLSNALPIKVSR